MAELSPFLNSSPKDRAYALGTTSRNLTADTGTWYEFLIYRNGTIVHTSGRLREETLRNYREVVKIYRRPKDRIRIKMSVTSFNRGYDYQAMFPYQYHIPPPDSKGQARIALDGHTAQSSPAMRNARQWTAGLGRTFRGGKSPVTRATALRPSPEIRTKPFLTTLQFGDPSSFTTTNGIDTVTTYYRSWTGNRTPGWGSKKPTRYVDNNHSVVLAEVHENRYSWYQVRPANGTFDLRIRAFTAVLPVPSVPFLHVDLAMQNALKRLIADAEVGMQANLALNIAQVSQLSGLILTSIGRISSAFNQLKRGNIPGAIGAFGSGVDSRWRGKKGNPHKRKSLADNWLELQYGWKPLLQDIEGFLKVMNRQGVNDFVQKARGTAKVGREVKLNQPDTTGIHGSNNGKTSFIFQTRCKYVIRYRMDDPLLALFSQTGFTNPINLFWELIPFSFVADWFLPIGNYLEALKAWEGYTFLGGSRTLFTKLRTDSTVAYKGPHPADPANVNVLNYANYRDEQVFLDRVALSSFPLPRFPNFFNGINGGNRALNAIALLSKGFK